MRGRLPETSFLLPGRGQRNWLSDPELAYSSSIGLPPAWQHAAFMMQKLSTAAATLVTGTVAALWTERGPKELHGVSHPGLPFAGVSCSRSAEHYYFCAL